MADAYVAHSLQGQARAIGTVCGNLTGLGARVCAGVRTAEARWAMRLADVRKRAGNVESGHGTKVSEEEPAAWRAGS